MAEAGNMGQRVDGNNALRQGSWTATSPGRPWSRCVTRPFPPGGHQRGVPLNGTKGVIVGIVASRLVEMRYRPTVVLTDSNDKGGRVRPLGEGFRRVRGPERMQRPAGTVRRAHVRCGPHYMERRNVRGLPSSFQKVVAATLTQEQRMRRRRSTWAAPLRGERPLPERGGALAPSAPAACGPCSWRGVRTPADALVGRRGACLKLH